MTIALVTDSNAQLPSELALRFAIIVVPMIVTIDGVDYQEGVDLDADSFYARFANGKRPDVRTSQPSPGAFAAAYRAAERNGATEVLSVHIGSAMSGTVNSARLGASMVDIPITIVDTASASFAVSCCVWEAGESLRAGGTVEEAATRAKTTAASVDSVFIVGASELARRGGRFGDTLDLSNEQADGTAISVIGFADNTMRVVGTARSSREAVTIMAETVLASPAARSGRLRVGLSVADAGAAPLYEGLGELLNGAPSVAELIRYRVGPSVGAHTGPGTAGAVWYPIS